MAWKIVHLKKEDIVSAEYGAGSNSGKLSVMLKEFCTETDCRKCLIDVRKMEKQLGILDINRTPDILKQMDLINGFLYAILVDYNAENFETFQLLASAVETKNYLYNYGITFRFFSEKEKALEWLRQNIK